MIAISCLSPIGDHLDYDQDQLDDDYDPDDYDEESTLCIMTKTSRRCFCLGWRQTKTF